MHNLKILHVLLIVIVAAAYILCCSNQSNPDDHNHVHENSTQGHNDNNDHEHEHDAELAHYSEGEDDDHEDSDHVHEELNHDQEVHDQDSNEELITAGGGWETIIGLKTAIVETGFIELLVSVPGIIIPDEDRVAVVSPFIESSVNEVFVNIGDEVKKGDLLVCLTSPEIGMLRAEYAKAKAECEIVYQNYERQRRLAEENIISEKSFQKAELEKQVAEVNYEYALKKLLALGIREEQIDNPPTGHSDVVGSTIHIHAPLSGVITRRNVRIGQKVDISTKMFEIIDLDKVWLEADIFEKDLTSIQSGQTVKMRVSAYPDEVFYGEVFYIGSTLKPETKTIRILVDIDNMDHKLKPGMFANTNIVIGQKQNTLLIPREALLKDENLEIVFVVEEEGYHRHIVTTGIRSDEYVEIVSGLQKGETVVTRGNYQLKSELKMTGTDPHAGHNH